MQKKICRFKRNSKKALLFSPKKERYETLKYFIDLKCIGENNSTDMI